jgi:chemotaxis protein histidine kinase CheA
MMPINNANRLLLFGLLAALSAPACRAQETPAPIDEANQGAGHASAAAPSATLAETAPPKAPKVTCSGDQLTISADNATLGGVLAAVHACTGVQVEIPEGAAGSRVFEELGPGPARQVLESLLSGTEFNYVIGSSDTNPQKIETVLLMSRPAETASALDAATNRTMTPGRRAWLQNRQNRSASLAADENHPAPDETSSTPEPEDAAAAPAENAGAAPAQAPANDQPAAAAEAPSSATNGAAPTAPTSNPESPSSASPSSNPSQSTEQRITDMQQLFQQRRQMNQNQNQSQNPASPQP